MQSPSYILCVICINLLIIQLYGQIQCFVPTTGTTLTFYAGAQTTSAKNLPIAQLTCNGGNGCKYGDDVKTVQCTCTGIDDYKNPQWKCQSDLPSDIELGKVLVSCEGCATSSSQFLVGSCGLYYDLNYDSNGDFSTYDDNNDNDNKFFSNFVRFLIVFFEIIFVVVMCVAIVASCISCCNK